MTIDQHTHQPSLSVLYLPAVLLLVASFSSVTAQAATGGQANADQLAESTDRAVGYLVKAARGSNDPKLNPSAASARPFWASVKRLNKAVDKLGRGLYLKDQTFFHGLGDAVSAVTAASVALSQSGAHDRKVKGALDRVERAVGLLDQKYGKVAARRAKGGSLSAQEQRKLTALREKQKELRQKLKAVEKKAAGNTEAIKGIERIRRESDRIYYARDTVADFVAALVAIRVVDGLLWGWHWSWGPWGGWVEHYSFAYVNGYYDAIDVMDYDWAITEAEVDLGDYDLEVAIDESDIADADDYLDAASLGVTADEIDALEGEGLTDDSMSPDLELRPEDIADSPETLPAEPESNLPDLDESSDYSELPEAIEREPSDYGAGAGFDADPPMDADVGGFDMPMDGGGADFDGGMDMDMGGGDIDF